MRGIVMCLLTVVTLLVLLRPVVPVSTVAAPAVPQDEGVYEEDFTAYTYKDYVKNAEWDVWARALGLEPIDGNYQGAHAVAIDGSGDAVVVWEDDRNGDYYYDIYAQRLDASGNKLWTADVRVNSDSGVARQEDPAVLMDGSGNITVVWRDNRNGGYDIYAQKLDGSGNKLWTADVCVNSDSGTVYSRGPAVAVDGSGNAVVVWHGGDIYAQKLDESGNKLWAADIEVNSDSGPDYWTSPAVAVDGGGNAVVVWHGGGIYAQRLDGNGNKLWAADVRVHSDSGVASQKYPAVVMDEGGNAFVVWQDNRNGHYDIYVQRLDRNGNRAWSADVRANSDSGTADQYHPAVAEDGSENAVVVWHDERNGNGDIYAQKLDVSGNRLWAADVCVNSDSGMAYQGSPAVAVDGNGNAVVAWQDYRNGNGDIYAQRLDGSGNRVWSADVRINSDSGMAKQSFPTVAMDGSGTAIVAWEDERDGDSDIYAQRLDGGGSKLWAADVRVNSDSGTVYQQDPTVAVDGSGNAFVVWKDWRNGNQDIYAQRLNTDGSQLWAADVRVNSDSGTGWPESPAVAVDGSGNAVIVWGDDGRDGNGDIYAQKLDGSGSKLWAADISVSSDSRLTWSYSVAVAVDESGNAVIVWTDERPGDWNIYAERLNASGSRLWAADVRVNSDSGTGDQSGPAVAVDGNGNVIVVWSDDRNGDYDYDICAQKLDASGNKLWTSDTRVDSDSGTASQWGSDVAVDWSGNAFVVWGDERSGNADIYAQRVNTVGGKAWLADLQVVYPDRFYFPTGTVQSRTVDDVADNITQANLTADYQTRGGSVQFHLTNDGGAHWAEVTPGVTHVFTTTGSDLRWRAVLSVDPIWNRTPVVSSLRIEYSTQMPYADDYEPDGTCAAASSLQVNGAAQQHTFHQYQDFDWARFEAITGTTYIVQAIHTGPDADLELELYDACGQPPTQSDDDAFANDARLVFTAPAAGVYYAKALNHDPAVYGEDTGYQLSVRTQSPAPVVAIVAGRNEANQLAENIIFMGDQAYRTFRRAGVPRENIRYLSVGANRDADQDGHLDVDGEPTWENVRYAVQDWPRERGVRLGVPFYLYLADHGGTDYYCAQGCAEEKQVTASDLNLWLSNLEATSGLDEIDVILEACYSGSFIDVTAYGPAEVSSPGRVVIASTGSQARAFPSQRGGYFSDAFFTALGDNADLWTSYVAGRTAAQAAWGEQTPWLDDNGDAVAGGGDGQVAQGRGLGSFGGGAIPVVDWLQVGGTASGVATVTAQVRDDVAVVAATVEVYPPGFTVPDTGEGETPVLDVDRVVLRDDDGDGVYEGSYGGFGEEGEYRMVAYAWDNDGNVSLPRQAVVPYPSLGEWKVYLPVVMRSD